MNQQFSNMNMNSNNMMDSLKSNIMTMMLLKNVNGGGGGNAGGGKSQSNQDMFSMIYVFIATNIVEFLFKQAPILFGFFSKMYMDKFDTMKRELTNSTIDITDKKIKKKTSSITITVNVNNPDHVYGQAILDFITNNKNTTHISYMQNNFILNQKDIITIDDDIFAKMTQSTGESILNTSIGGSQTTNTQNAGTAIVQIIEVYSFTKSTDQLREYLENIKQKYVVNIKNKLGNKKYFFNLHPINAMMDINKQKDYSRLPPNMLFTMKHFQTNRRFTNLFGKDMDIIRNRVNFFCKNKKWYDEKGIPYTLGLLLSGNPGTGKTSTIKCLANETNRHICNINLNNDITKRQLENLFFDENICVLNQNTGQTETFCIPLDQRIYVLEDIDCQSDIVKERSLLKTEKMQSGTEKEKTDNKIKEEFEDKHKIDLSFLLNLLDGVLENPGRIVIMTSNHPDMLDTALIRPGRIDIIAKFQNCLNETIVNMLEFFYDIKLSQEDIDNIMTLEPEIVTPAEFSKIMFENFRDYKKSMECLTDLSEKFKHAKKEVEEQETKRLEMENNYKKIDLMVVSDMDFESDLNIINIPNSVSNEQLSTTLSNTTKPNQIITPDESSEENEDITKTQTQLVATIDENSLFKRGEHYKYKNSKKEISSQEFNSIANNIQKEVIGKYDQKIETVTYTSNIVKTSADDTKLLANPPKTDPLPELKPFNQSNDVSKYLSNLEPFSSNNGGVASYSASYN